ncbi:MAG: redoxin domain-containing protein [Phototrophicaceae bacterium]
MQTFLITSAILSWFVILFNLILGLVLVRRFRQLDVDHKPEVLQSGEKAPNFSLESLDGGITSLEDYKNQESLMVFVSPSCEPCRAQMPQIEASGTQLLMVSLGDKEQTVLLQRI